MLCKPHSNVWNHARADRRTITHDIKWPVKYGQITENNMSVKMHEKKFFPKNEICDQI